MILSKFKDQILLIPTIGFVKDLQFVRLVISFLCFAISFTIAEIHYTDERKTETDSH